MNNNYALPTLYEDDASDSLSSMGAKSVSIDSMESPSPFFVHLSDMCDIDALSSQTKKIRKKRCAYDKIDDDKRIELLNAVQKSGESLKSAAKRLNINYSSAKSILHTFRKEGRILKKSPLDNTVRSFSMYSYSLPSTAMEVSPMNNASRNMSIPTRFPSQGAAPTQKEIARPYNQGHSGGSPMRGLTSIFANMILDKENAENEPSFMNLMLEVPQPKQTVSIPKLNVPSFSQANTSASTDESLDAKEIKIPSLSEPAPTISNPPVNQIVSNPLELLKKIDNFYMNYSNSPLSGGKGTMFGDCSDSGSRKYGAKEFDSFSDMLTAFQTPGSCTDELKVEFQSSAFCRLNTIPEVKLIKEDSSDSITGTGNIDPQWLISDGLRKATFMNNLGQFQRPGISLVNERNK